MPYVPPFDIEDESVSDFANSKTETRNAASPSSIPPSSSTERNTRDQGPPSKFAPRKSADANAGPPFDFFGSMLHLDALEGIGQFGEVFDASWDSDELGIPHPAGSWATVEGCTSFHGICLRALHRVGLTRIRLHAQSGIPYRSVRRWFAGKNLPTGRNVPRLMLALSLSQSEKMRFVALLDEARNTPARVRRRERQMRGLRRYRARIRGRHRNGMTDAQYLLVRRAQTRERVRRFRERRKALLASLQPTQPTTPQPERKQDV